MTRRVPNPVYTSTNRVPNLTQSREESLRSREFAGSRRICPGCFRELTVLPTGRYPRHRPFAERNRAQGWCPAGGRLVYHNGVIL